MRDQADFEALWKARDLDRIAGLTAFGETITARTFAAIDAPSPSSSFSPPELPTISLDLPAPGAGPGRPPTDGRAAAGHDLEVIGTLGEGGMGLVLLARQRSLEREVAVKVLRPAAADAAGELALLREAVVTGGVEHPNIVPVHALGRDADGRPVLVMKRVEGTSWKQLLDDPAHAAWGPLLDAHGDRAAASLEVLARVADAAHFAHARGVVHRDIKPENVMVGAFGEVYLVDWGIAARVGRDRPAEEGGAWSMRGTPAFMAPEMVEGDPARVDARTDVYLLGATLHEALTGTPRHRGENLFAVLWAAQRSEPVAYAADVPDELAALCNEATSADPARRPQSALEFRRRLAEYGRHRAGLTLAAAAAGRLATLRELVARADDAEAPRAQRLAVECRFAFAQALEVWPGNDRARAGLAEALRLLLAHELARENLDAARALADELDDRDPATAARLAALADALSLRRARAEAALAEARETDLSRGHSERPRFVGLVLAGVVGANAAARALVARGGPPNVGRHAALNAALLAVLLVAVALGRRGLLVTRVSRQVTALAVLYVGSTLLHRVLAYLAGETSIPSVLRGDLVTLAAISAVGAVGIRPWFGWLALCAALGAVATTVDPARAITLYGAATGAMLLLALYFGWVRVGRGDAP